MGWNANGRYLAGWHLSAKLGIEPEVWSKLEWVYIKWEQWCQSTPIHFPLRLIGSPLNTSLRVKSSPIWRALEKGLCTNYVLEASALVWIPPKIRIFRWGKGAVTQVTVCSCEEKRLLAYVWKHHSPSAQSCIAASSSMFGANRCLCVHEEPLQCEKVQAKKRAGSLQEGP